MSVVVELELLSLFSPHTTKDCLASGDAACFLNIMDLQNQRAFTPIEVAVLDTLFLTNTCATVI